MLQEKLDRLSGVDRPGYTRHKPEQTQLYRLVECHWPEFQSFLTASDRHLPRHVIREFDDYLACGRLERGFLRVGCEDCRCENLVAFSCKRRGFCPSCGAKRMIETAALLVDDILPHKPVRQWVLSFPYPLRFLLSNHPQVVSGLLAIVNRVISTYLIHQSGFTKRQAHTGAVTLIQRFGSALNLNVHFHILFIDGVYQDCSQGELRFHRAKAPSASDLNTLVATISQRAARYLEREGLLTHDNERHYLTLDLQDDDALSQLQGSSITYRIAVGPQQGRKVFTLQTMPSWEEEGDGASKVGKAAGFSLHAGVSTKTQERKKLERLCRYIARPGISEQRLSITTGGKVRYELKTPYRDGTTHVIFEPLDFIAKLAALIPKPRANLTRFHGVLAPNSKHRASVTPAKRGKGNPNTHSIQGKSGKASRSNQRQPLTWAHRLKRVFNIDITTCCYCGGQVRIIACIEDPWVIRKILAYVDGQSGAGMSAPPLPEARASPQLGLF